MRLHSLLLGLRYVLVLGSLLLGAQANAQTQFPIATFPFPSVSNIIADIIIAKEFDKANGIKVVPIIYGTGGALWAGLAKGEIPGHNMSPFQLQKMRADGVPIRLYAGLLKMTALQVVTKNPEVKTFADLKGRSFAGTVAFAEFSYLQIYARTLGLEMTKDMQIVDANSALAQAQLVANRVDAIMIWEPSATAVLREYPDVRVILKGDDAWKAVTGDIGWELDLVIREDFVEKNPGALPRVLKMYQDAGNFIRTHPEEADAIVTSGKYASKGIAPGNILAGVKGGRLIYDVQPAWDPSVNAQIWKMLEVGLKYNQIPALPEKQAVMDRPPS